MLELHPILPAHTLSWVRVRAAAYYGPTHECLHSGRVSESSMRGIAEDWKRGIGKKDMWHWRIVDTALTPNEDDGDGEEGKTVGIAVWSMHNVPKDKEVVEGKEEGKKEAEEHKPFVPPELRVVALMSLLGPLRAAQPEVMTSPEPYFMLNQLATHPDHQGRGIGKLLLDWGMNKADEEGLVCYLNATEVGKRMYEKRGFEVRKVIEWDREPWGGEGVDRHWCMVREPVRRE